MTSHAWRSLGAALLGAGLLVPACTGFDAASAPPDPVSEAGADAVAPDAIAPDANPLDAADAAPSTCVNKVKDPGETDIDCGGSCAPCNVGQVCATAKDCATGLCAATSCAPWQRALSGTANVRAAATAVDAQGNVYVTGDFFTDFNLGNNSFTTLHSAGSCDAFVAKFDQGGNWLWSSRFGGTECDYGLGITLDGQGDAFVVGTSLSPSIDLGLVPPAAPAQRASSANADLFVLRLASADGKTKWAKTYGAGTVTQDVGIPRSYGIALDAKSNLWIVANATAATDYGAGAALTPAGADDALVLRIAAADGAYASATLAGGLKGDAAQAVVADAQGVYVTGYFEDGINFGLALPLAASGGHDAFVVAFDLAGAPRWQRRLGGDNGARPFGSDRGHAIHTDPDGNVYVGGLHSGGAMDLGGGITAPAVVGGGIAEAFAASYKSDGTPRWALAFGGIAVDLIYGVRADGAGNVVVAGYTESPSLDVGSGVKAQPLPRSAFVSVLSDTNGVPKQGRFLGRAGSSEPAFLALRPGTRSLYLVGSFGGALQSLGVFGAAAAGAADLSAVSGSDGWLASLGNVP